MTVKEFYTSVNDYVNSEEGKKLGSYVVSPYDYKRGFSEISDYDDKLVLEIGDELYEDEGNPSLKLEEFMDELKRCADSDGEKELYLERDDNYEVVDDFIVSYGQLVPMPE